MNSKRTHLGLFSNVPAIEQPHGKFVLAGRLLSGMDAHLKFFDGEMTCVCEPAPPIELLGNRDRLLGGDNVEVDPRELPFRLLVTPFDSPQAREALARFELAIVGIGHRTTHLSRWGRETGTLIVYGTEYTLATRLQVIRASVSNPLLRLRRTLWERALERRQRAAIRIAAGVHCNGTPTFDEYRHVNERAMLFFDGRMGDHMLVGERDQRERAARLRRGEPLRLAWSGRLNKMKGADHLPRIARELDARGVPFRLEIFGGGTCEAQIRGDIERLGLGSRVFARGFVDFYKELTPHLQREVDVWICPHVQGDPSGAYMEAFGDGLPIVGYGNEALAGMLRLVDAGAAVPVGDTKALAGALADLHTDRERLVTWSGNALAYAREHTFDRSFERRMKHIRDLLDAREGIAGT